MRILHHLLFLFAFCGLGLAVSSCKTEDIDPNIRISLDSISNERVKENGGIAHITASLNGKSEKEVRLSVHFGGTAQSGLDYAAGASEIVIPSGSLTGSILITGLQDNLVEADESVIITFGLPQNATFLDSDTLILLVSDDDSDTDHDGINDSEDVCPLDSGTVANNGCPEGFGLIINEVLYDPAAGTDGDANGDGITDKYQDGFVELYNNSSAPQNLGGFSISDLVISGSLVTERYVFPSGTILPPKKALVVFGGGTPTGMFGGATVLVVGTALGLSMQNSGEKILIKDPQGTIILTFDTDALSNNPDESYTRNPDITGDFVQHGAAISGKLFSAGTKTDGSPF